MGCSRIVKTLCLLLAELVLVMGIPVQRAFGNSTGESLVRDAAGQADEGAASVNRYNVVIVMDASGSMNGADAKQLRFEAVDQFLGLMTNRGNTLGGVVFTDSIVAKEDIKPVNSAADKERIKKLLRSNTTKDGDTDIGEALSTAVDMLQKDGDKKLQSRIIMLSDGITELNNVPQQVKDISEEKKETAVKRASESGIQVYCVCLDADKTAKKEELEKITTPTHGRTTVVSEAKDLKDAFNVFYSDIYGSYATTITDGSFPQDGKIEVKLPDIPEMGVEEMNVVVFGKCDTYNLTDYNNTVVEPTVISSETFNILKVLGKDVTPGKWNLELTGAKDEEIRIDVVLNTDLEIKSVIEPSKKTYSPKDELTIRAYLSQDGKNATSSEQLNDYSAAVHIVDANTGEEVSVEKFDNRMKLQEGHFESRLILPEGTYAITVNVASDYSSRYSTTIGPIAVNAKEANTNPRPVEKYKEYPSWSMLPFPLSGSKPIEIDLRTLATDEEDDELEYEILSSTFSEDDYYYDKKNERIFVEKQDMGCNTFMVQAVDDYGATCDIEVAVKRRSVLAAAAAAILSAIAVFVLVKIIRNRLNYIVPFNGDITVWSSSSYPKTIRGGKGRIPLSSFNNLGNTGLDYEKSYVQASGKDFITLYTDRLAICNGVETMGVDIKSGEKETDIVVNGYSEKLYIRFDKN